MRVACIIVLLASGASGESDECAAGPDGAQICREDVAIGDTTSLLQVHNRQLETVAATLTRRCSTEKIPPDCTFGEWEQWSACSKTCGTGTRKRSRRVTSQGKETCCTEEGEICNVEGCPTTTPSPTGPPPGPPCKVGDWTDWGACSETCGWGMRNRSRELISAGSSDDPECCAEEGVQCKIKDCPGPVHDPTPTPTTPPPMDWVIQLDWGLTPLDLDAKTFWNWPAGAKYGRCHVSYDAKNGACTDKDDDAGITAELNKDHCFAVDGKHTCKSASVHKAPAPEITMLKGVDGGDGEVVFEVNNHWQSKTWSNKWESNWPQKDTGTFKGSKAIVTVFHPPGNKVASFNVEKDGHWMWTEYQKEKPPHGMVSPEEWWVFSIDRKSGEVTPCDCTNKGGKGYCGGCGR